MPTTKMSIEEWLDKKIEDAQEELDNQEIETYAEGYAEGYRDAFELVRDMLPSFGHEVTVREAKVNGSWWLKGAQRERWSDHEDNIAFREEVRRS